MPKRPKSPPPDPDEPHHLAVFYPYLSNGNLDSVEDRHHTARWLACCIGKDDLLALFHRPGAKSTIIIEVKKSCPHIERLLGAHDWSKILKNPTADQRSVASKVFFCRLSTQSKVKKAGWKRIDVEEHWFKGWDPEHGVFTFPYPSTYRCEPPPEADPVHKNLCLNLPVQHFPVPEPARPPPVGSPEWLARKQAGTWSTSKPRSKAVKNALASSPQLVMPTPSRPAAVPPATVLARGTSAGPSAPSPVTPISPANAWAKPSTSGATPQAPPGIPVPPGFVPRNGASPAADAFPPPPGLSRTPSNASPALNASPELSSSEGDSTGWWSPTAIEADGASPVTPFVQEPGRFEQVMAGLAFEDDHEYEQEEWGDHGPPDLWAAPPPHAQVQVQDSLWPAQDVPPAPPETNKLVCSVHGVVCKRGICEVWAKQKREFDWEEKQRERQRERPRKGKGQGRDEASAEGGGERKHPRARDVQPKTDPNAKPAHLQKGRDREKPPHLQTAGRAKPANLTAETRPKPAHLQRGTSGGRNADAAAAPPPTARGPAPTGTWAAPARAPSPAATVRGARSEGGSTAAGWPDAATSPWDGKSAAGADKDETRSVAPSEPSGWGDVSEGPWKAGTGPATRAPSVAPSSRGGWGNVSEGPWKNVNAAAPDARSESGWGSVSEGPWKSNEDSTTRKFSRAWADDVEDELGQVETGSVAASSATGGWGNPSEGPWGA